MMGFGVPRKNATPWLSHSKKGAYCLCVLIMVGWAIVLALGNPLDLHLGRHWEVGFNGTSIRVLWTQTPQTSLGLISWDVLYGLSLWWEATEYDAFVSIPILPIFGAALGVAVVIQILERHSNQRSSK